MENTSEKARIDAGFSLTELRSAFSTDESKEQFFKNLYFERRKRRCTIFQQLQGITDPNIRNMFANSLKIEINKAKKFMVKGPICLLVGILGLLLVSSLMDTQEFRDENSTHESYAMIMFVGVVSLISGLALLIGFGLTYTSFRAYFEYRRQLAKLLH